MASDPLTSIDEIKKKLSELKDEAIDWPGCVRYCEGGTSDSDKPFLSKRLFVSTHELWLDPTLEADEIKSQLEDVGYRSYAEQRVPLDEHRHFDSTYYCHENSEKAKYYLKRDDKPASNGTESANAN